LIPPKKEKTKKDNTEKKVTHVAMPKLHGKVPLKWHFRTFCRSVLADPGIPDDDFKVEPLSQKAIALRTIRSVIRSSSSTMNKAYKLHSLVTGDLISSAGAVINTTSSDASGLTSSSDWASLIIVFDEILPLGCEVLAAPNNKYSKVAVISRPLLLVHDDDTVTTLISYSDNYEQYHVTNVDDMFPKWLWFPRPISPVSSTNGWQNSSSLSLVGGFSWFSNALSASTTYGTAFYRYHFAMRMQY